jgi:hypothetical protein
MCVFGHVLTVVDVRTIPGSVVVGYGTYAGNGTGTDTSGGTSSGPGSGSGSSGGVDSSNYGPVTFASVVDSIGISSGGSPLRVHRLSQASLAEWQ